MATLRVRQILSNLNVNQKTALKKLLPSKLSVPDCVTHKYPSALLGMLPEDDVGKYAHLGILTEELLRLPSASITVETLMEVLRGYLSDFTEEMEVKLRKSVTTQPYLDCVKATRVELEKVLRSGEEEGPLKFEEEVVFGSVAGHPDMWNKTQVFEVKTTGMLKENWTSFLFQAFAYGALMPSVKDIYLVLPLQKLVWHSSMASWSKREEFRTFMTSWSDTAQTDRVTAHLQASLLCAEHCIGCHIRKQKTLTETIRAVAHSPAPYQIFLSGPRDSNIKASDEDLASALAIVQESGARMFVHSQYLINLANKDVKPKEPKKVREGDVSQKKAKKEKKKDDDRWNETMLIKNLQICRSFGGQGVVVHVGKYTNVEEKYKAIAKARGEKLDIYKKVIISESIENMRAAIQRCLEHAHEDCPLLLETPAGQGTELLTDMKEFLDFVESFATPKLRVCLDTCHVFAAGHDPKTYLEAALARPGLLKLVHYNDSLGSCGSCVDRHAHIATGEGLIGFPKMAEIAEICSAHQIPMVIE